MKLITVLYLFSLFVALTLGGECLKDSNTNQPSSAWNKRLWTYSPSHAAAVSSSTTLKFMNYNLQSSISNNCVSNAPTQAQYMAGNDYVGNEEVVQGVDTRCNCNMPQIISSGTGMTSAFVMTFPWRTGQYGIMSSSSQKVLDTKYNLYTYANAEQRALVAIKTQPPGLGGKYLWFITTHIDYTVSAARHAEAQQLVAWVQNNIIAHDSQAIVVATGDFNAGPEDAMYQTMSTMFKNAWQVFHGSSGGGATYPANSPGSRFDHMWYRVPSSVSASVKSFDIPAVTYSDHRPIKVSINFAVSGGGSAPAPSPAVTAKPTSAPTSTPAHTSAPTTKPTSGPTPAPSSGQTCAVSYGFDSVANAVVITNTGGKPVKSLTVAFSPSLPSNHWNWMSQGSNHYTLPSYAYQQLSAKNSKYTSSGYYLPAGSSRPSASTVSISC